MWTFNKKRDKAIQMLILYLFLKILKAFSSQSDNFNLMALEFFKSTHRVQMTDFFTLLSVLRVQLKDLRLTFECELHGKSAKSS